MGETASTHPQGVCESGFRRHSLEHLRIPGWDWAVQSPLTSMEKVVCCSTRKRWIQWLRLRSSVTQRVQLRTINIMPPKLKHGSWNGDWACSAHTLSPVTLTDTLLFQIYSSNVSSTVWGRPALRLPPTYAALVNGVAVRSFPCLSNC